MNSLREVLVRYIGKPLFGKDQMNVGQIDKFDRHGFLPIGVMQPKWLDQSQ